MFRLHFTNFPTPHPVFTSFKIHLNSDYSPPFPLVLHKSQTPSSLRFLCCFLIASNSCPLHSPLHSPIFCSPPEPSLTSRRGLCQFLLKPTKWLPIKPRRDVSHSYHHFSGCVRPLPSPTPPSALLPGASGPSALSRTCPCASVWDRLLPLETP